LGLREGNNKRLEKMHNDEFHNFRNSINNFRIIKSKATKCTPDVGRKKEMRKSQRMLVRNFKRKYNLGLDLRRLLKWVLNGT
jgi:hypothetical protein